MDTLSSSAFAQVAGQDNVNYLETYHASRVGDGFRSLHFVEAKRVLSVSELEHMLEMLVKVPPSLILQCQVLGKRINVWIGASSSLHLRDAIACSGETALDKKVYHFEQISDQSALKYGRRVATFIWYLLLALDEDKCPSFTKSLKQHERLVSALTVLKTSLCSANEVFFNYS